VSKDTYKERLAPLVDICAWTRGQWDFGLREHREWNDLQNTSKDIIKLADLLLRSYRASSLAAPQQKLDGIEALG
jgi:hypothetical protein